MTISAELRGRQEDAFASVALQYTDAVEYQPVDIIMQALADYAAGTGADCIAVRCLRPHFRPDGTPILNAHGEQIRAVLAGVFALDQLRDAAELDARDAEDPRDCLVSGAGGRWHCYFHPHRVVAPVTGRLLPGKQGTVAGDCIAAYMVFVVDLDPIEGAVPGDAVEVANKLAQFLIGDLGCPPGAILIQQSGRGAYVLVLIEPQALEKRPVLRDALKTVARLVAAASNTVKADLSVHDPPRILRIAGTTNHKPGADPTTPSWVLKLWTPGIRMPWSAVERLAAPSRPKLRLIPGGRTARRRHRQRRPLRELFAIRGWLFGERADGICDVRCPNATEHTDGRHNAILYPAKEPGGPGWVHCSHDHCANLTLGDVYAALEDV